MITLVLTGAAALLAALSLLVGVVWTTPAEAWNALAFGDPPLLKLLLLELRLPRVLLALLVGAALGITGAALQGLTRNPLAEAGLLGVSSGAALGAVAALYSGLSLLAPLALPLAALTGAMIAVLPIALLAARLGTLGLILAGVAVSSLAGALTALALNFAPSPYAALEIVFWLLGSLADRSMQHVWLAAPFILGGAALLLTTRRGLDALSLGEEAAASLGIALVRLRLTVMLGAAAAVGAAVSVSGAIGFVGLIVPHLLRPFVRARPGALLLPSAAGGALMLLAADTLVRALPPRGPELKLGVVTALLGAPFLLRLLWSLRGRP
ncbi:FecCD family ABC transporter permease [Roseococcus pinisoli]|uniref:Iron ABC transporter permease n=1 Tax=Roseococcus pinisoli TaxID=2835040 RepID=A0ABS5QEU9_9PROT|nr:iron ABC transporter permease [Roseococcus pinisoli]